MSVGNIADGRAETKRKRKKRHQIIFWLLLRPFISLDERENEGITKTDV
jgi:hypothetical protein